MSNPQDDECRRTLMNSYNHDKSPETADCDEVFGNDDALPDQTRSEYYRDAGSNFQDDDEYCEALAWAISKGKCPMTVGLYVPWGRCKDALLQKIKKYLDDISEKSENGKKSVYGNNENRKLTIKQLFEFVFRMLFYIPIITKKHEKYKEHNIFFEFSAWHCTGCDRLWAGLITTLCDEIEDEFGRLPISLYRALYKGNKIREESASKEWVLKKLMSDLFLTLFVILFLICALLLQFLLYIFNESEYYQRLKDYVLYAAVTTFGSFLLLQSGMILKVLKNYIVTQKGKLMRKLKRTDMSSQLGFMNDVKKEVEIITSYLQMMEVFQKKKMRVIIKITKLDKCMPDRVVEVLHAINILLSNVDAPFICILAVDPGIIVECVEKSSLLKGMANNGYLFLNRIVTLAFSIPKMNDKTKRKYLAQIINAKDTKESTSPESTSLAEVNTSEKEIDPTEKRNTLIRGALDLLKSEKYCQYITDNTINMRRIVNTIIITVSLMMNEDKYKSNLDKVTKWVIMAAQWPCSLSWILQCIEDEQQSREDQKSDSSTRQFCKRQLWEIYEMSLDALHANRESLQQLLELDGDPDILYKLLKTARFTVGDANILRNYTINLDHTIQRKIELLQGSFNFLRFKEEKTLNRMALLEMDTKAVCTKMKNLNLQHKDYIEKIEQHNLNGKALLYSDNNEIRKALGMNMGDWVKFRAAFLSLPTPNLYF